MSHRTNELRVPLLRHLLEHKGVRQNSEYLTIRELAARLDVRIGHLRALVARGEIPVSRIGRLLRFRWASIESWLEGRSELLASLSGSPRPRNVT